METVLEFLRKCEVFYVATTDGEHPHLRPFGAAVRWNGQILIQTGSQKPVARQIRANPHVEIVACDGGNWMRISAAAREVNDPDAEACVYAAYPYLREAYTETSPMMVLALTQAEATWFPAEAEPETICF